MSSAATTNVRHTNTALSTRWLRKRDGEPTHEHGMTQPRQGLGRRTLAATTTGPIRSGT